MNLREKTAYLISFLLIFIFTSNIVIDAYAVTDYQAESEQRKLIPIDSNEIDGWPAGPVVSADAAILYEANTGTILYAKNIYSKEYPASTTKLLTSLIAFENCSMDEEVYFSSDAVGALSWDSSNMGISAGNTLTMEQALYGVLVGSANEAANAIGEHISGSMSSFADFMTQRAKELGCVNSNFVNANGLYDDNHYTCAYDLAVIGAEFFRHDLLCRMSSSYSYTVNDEITVYSHNKLLPHKDYAYEYLVGSKTGYTDLARQTLVSCAEKDGMKLVCVVLKEEAPNQFTDTISLFNYGFSNFTCYNVKENEKDFNIQTYDFFQSELNLFANSTSILQLDPSAKIVLPITADLQDASKSISYENDGQSAAIIRYSYLGVQVGKCNILISAPAVKTENSEENTQEKIIYINVKMILLWVLIIAALLIFTFWFVRYCKNYHFSFIQRKRRSQKRKRGPRSEFDKFNF